MDPVSYLAQRGDIALVHGWQQAVEDLDCGYQAYPPAFADSTERLLPGLTFARPDDESAATLSVVPDVFAVGDAVSLRAAGFTPNTALRVMYNGYSLGLALPSDADGRLMLSGSLPPGVAPGVHVLGRDDGNGNIASTIVSIR